MPDSYPEQYQRKREYLSEEVEGGRISTEDANAIRELCDAFDEKRPSVSRPNWPDAPSRLTSYREPSTLSNWIYHLARIAKEVELLDTSADDINRLMGEWLRGEGVVKDDGLSKGSLRAYQNTARIFYRLHDNVGIDHDDIEVFDQEDSKVTPHDMLSPEEVEQVRDAPDSPRDQAIVYLLLYTGLRNTALRTLRVKDVELNPEPRFYFNTDADGLKDISRPQEPRPLLGAESAIRTWLEFHPTGKDDHYLITGKPKWGNVDPTEPISRRTIARVMDSVKEETGIEKPMHPHAMRHNFVSVCKREYGMDDDAVKFLIGHDPDSTVMSTTYAHLSGEDYAQKAEVAAGIRDETDSSLSPEKYCDSCGEPLPDNAKACPSCGTTYTPDARVVKDQISDSIRSALVESDDGELREILGDVDSDIAENPELLESLIEWKQDNE